MWRAAPSTPSTTATARIGSRYSVRQSFSVAGIMEGTSARAASSPRSSQPAAARSAAMGGSRRSAPARSTSRVSAAPHTETRRILAFTAIARALPRSAALSM